MNPATAAEPLGAGRHGRRGEGGEASDEHGATAAVDVVIITWNDPPDILESSIASVQSSLRVSPNLIVVDNGSRPPATVPDAVTLVRNAANLGVARARNQGIAMGQAPLVCILDSDAQLLPETLAALAVRIDGDVAMAAPVFVGQAPEESAGRSPGMARKIGRLAGLTKRYASMRQPVLSDAWDVEFAIGACQMFTRAAWHGVGGLDQSYLYGPEDLDFCDRLRRDGGRIVQISAARCIHPPRRRHRSIVSRSGLRHGRAVLRYLWRRRWAARVSA